MSDGEITSLPNLEVNQVIDGLSQRIDWGLKDSNVPSTWTSTKGKGITCMVIDTGHPQHPDLDGNVLAGQNFVSGEGILDENGHQTHCTGIICAKDNQIGVIGVAPEAQCVSVKALGKNGTGRWEDVEKALDFAILQKPDIVSMSLGSATPVSAVHDKIKTLYSMDIPVVCAAGNSGNAGVNYPAAFDETIAVAAYDANGNVPNFSARGDKVEWTAPGVDIYSTYINNSYASLSGTSMACPFIAGVICLMLAKHKEQEALTGKNDCKTVKEIREHLLKYTTDRGALGKDNTWGYGVIDVGALINAIAPPPKPIPHYANPIQVLVHRILRETSEGRLLYPCKFSRKPYRDNEGEEQLPNIRLQSYTDEENPFGENTHPSANIITSNQNVTFLLAFNKNYGPWSEDAKSQLGLLDWISRFKDAIELDDEGCPDLTLNNTCVVPLTSSVIETSANELSWMIEFSVTLQPAPIARGTRSIS